MEYPRKVTIENSKIKRLIEEKAEIILKGRKVSEEIETLEAEMAAIDKEIQEIESKVDLRDLEEKATIITGKLNKANEDMEELNKEIYARMRSVVPAELTDNYEKKKKQKENLENGRNKLALKATKYNDRIIPLARKALKPFLTDEYEDFDGMKIEEGTLVGSIFSHLDEFKKRFHSKK